MKAMHTEPEEQAPRSNVVEKSDSLWGSVVDFMKRLIKLFFPCEDTDDPLTEKGEVTFEKSKTKYLAPEELHIESLVDVNRLPEMAFRREVLDWRDNYHANLMITLSKLHDAFLQQINTELSEISLLRKLVTQNADQVLQDSFIRLVRRQLIVAVRKEEAKLNACAHKWGLPGKSDFTFDISVLRAECRGLHDIGFKPSNKDLILFRTKELLLGNTGLVAPFRDQGLQLARKLMDIKAS